MLRIDVNGTSTGHAYRIPRSNPYVGAIGRDEIWSRGLRNPWRWSFDRVTGDLWIGDVGQDRYEEIDRPHGVRPRTRRRLRMAGHGGQPLLPARDRVHHDRQDLPITEYSPSPGLLGDRWLRLPRAERAGPRRPLRLRRLLLGLIWTIGRGALRPATKSLLLDTDLQISSFGEDERGELYVVSLGGTVFRLEAS